MIDAPLVSVLLPVRNGAPFVGQAVASILAQTLRELEVIIVDDGSDDDTPRLLEALARRDPRLRVIRQPKRGLVAALNRAASAARADLLARMDADDLSHPDRLAAQRTLLLGSPALAAVSCLVRPLDAPSPGWRAYLAWINSCVTPEEIAREILVESPLAHPSVLMRRELFERVGGYRAFDGPEDYDLWLRFAALGFRFAKVPRALFTWRDTPQRLSRTDRRYRAQAFAKLKGRHVARALLPERADRPVVIWGAGRYGRWLGRALAAEGVQIVAYVDIDPKKIGRTRGGAPVIAPAELARHRSALIFGAVPIPEARRLIREQLRAQGRREGSDYWICS